MTLPTWRQTGPWAGLCLRYARHRQIPHPPASPHGDALAQRIGGKTRCWLISVARLLERVSIAHRYSAQLTAAAPCAWFPAHMRILNERASLGHFSQPVPPHWCSRPRALTRGSQSAGCVQTTLKSAHAISSPALRRPVQNARSRCDGFQARYRKDIAR